MTTDDMNVPWELIRFIQQRAVSWARTVDGMSGNGDPPHAGGTGTDGRLSDAAAAYYDLKRALSLLRLGGRGAPHRPADAALLCHIVDLWLEGNGKGQIGRHLRRSRLRRMRGGNQFWTARGVSHALDRAFCWLCHPKFGRLLTSDEWRAGELDPRRDRISCAP
jgi:hypothetical protein